MKQYFLLVLIFMGIIVCFIKTLHFSSTSGYLAIIFMPKIFPINRTVQWALVMSKFRNIVRLSNLNIYLKFIYFGDKKAQYLHFTEDTKLM